MTQTETLELLVATLQQANSSQSESIERLTRQNEQLQNKLQELLAQVAWLNRQLFGRKSEKLAHLDPNQLSLFDLSESFVIPVLNNTKIQKSNRIIKVSPAVFQYCMSLFRNAFRRLSLLEGSSLIPSTIRTRSRHCIGYDLLSLS